jgi:hypothetical protein
LSRKQADLIFSVILLGIVGWMTWEALKWDRRASLFPVAIGVPATLLCLLQLGFAVRGVVRTPVVASIPAELVEDIPAEVARQRTRDMVLWILGITVGIVGLGFELGSALISFAFLRFAARERVRVGILVGMVTYLFFYVIFDRALSIPFPPGVLAELLGQGEPLDHLIMNPIANLLQGG